MRDAGQWIAIKFHESFLLTLAGEYFSQVDKRSAAGVVRPRWLTELTREPSAVNPVAVGGILPKCPGACHMQSDALTPAGFSINHYNSGRISGEWGRPNGVLRFLWAYFFGRNPNFSCRRVDGGQLLMRECQRLRDVLGGIFQARAMAGARFNIFIDT